MPRRAPPRPAPPAAPRAAALLLLPLAGAGCSDYALDKTAGLVGPPGDTGAGADGGGAGAPALAVSPAAGVDLGVTCGPTRTPLLLSSVGGAAVTVSALPLAGEGWAFAAPPALPLVLEPGASAALELIAGDGDGLLQVISDDPAAPVRELPLSATPDLPPALTVEPLIGDPLLDIGATAIFTARVEDESDPASLRVRWRSDQDGVLADTPVEADGRSTLTWPAEGRSAGPHVLSAEVVDACGQAADDRIGFCQQAGYAADALGLDSWAYEGSAFWDAAAGAVELTDLSPFAAGAAFQTSQAVPGHALRLSFEFTTGDGTGADGFSVTALDVDRRAGLLGAPGCALGYGEPHPSCVSEGEALPGWSIEVDTYYNPSIDPSSNDHLSLTFDGDLDTWALWADLPEVEDTGPHTLEVELRAGRARVWLDGALLADERVSIAPFDAWIGFTAATGVDTNKHTIRALTVEGDACDGYGGGI
jgi:hypothetical protein